MSQLSGNLNFSNFLFGILEQSLNYVAHPPLASNFKSFYLKLL